MNEYTANPRFIDLASQQKLIRHKIDMAISKVLDHGQYIMGPEVSVLEDRLKDFAGAKYAITCANGTDAISLVLRAWNISPGTVIFVPSFTYVASAEAVAQLGAVPFFVDVCEKTFNMCLTALKQQSKSVSRLASDVKLSLRWIYLDNRPASMKLSSLQETKT